MFVDDERAMPFTREMCRKLAERGWLTIAWSVEHGGSRRACGCRPILREEMWAREEPRGPQYMNLNYIGPLIMRFGTPEQRAALPAADGARRGHLDAGVLRARRRLRPRVARDPRRGSWRPLRRQRTEDLVELRRRACRLVPSARADRSAGAPKHKRDLGAARRLETPGVTVRPIDTMAGPHEFNEMFFDDVVVPHDCLLGPQNEGWDLVRHRSHLRACRHRPIRACGARHRAARRARERDGPRRRPGRASTSSPTSARASRRRAC